MPASCRGDDERFLSHNPLGRLDGLLQCLRILAAMGVLLRGGQQIVHDFMKT